MGGLEEGGARREREREGGDHGIAGAGDVGDLIGAGDRDVRGRPIGLEQRHPAAAARDQHGRRTGALQQFASRPLEHARVLSNPDVEELLDL